MKGKMFIVKSIFEIRPDITLKYIFIQLLTIYHLKQKYKTVTNTSQFVQLMTSDFVKEANQNPKLSYCCS